MFHFLTRSRALAQSLRELLDHPDPRDGNVVHLNNQIFRGWVEAYEALPPMAGMTYWRPVHPEAPLQELPPDQQEVLVCLEHDQFTTARYFVLGQVWRHAGIPVSVRAWRPLPKAPAPYLPAEASLE